MMNISIIKKNNILNFVAQKKLQIVDLWEIHFKFWYQSL